MSKYSDFPPIPQDRYLTPYESALPLRAFLSGVSCFAEPCCANGQLVRWLESFGLRCNLQSDLDTGVDALTDLELARGRFDAIITNPPYTWRVLEAMINRFMRIAPTWMLLEADFKYKIEARKFIANCSDIVPVGRVKWFPGSKHDSKGAYAWYRFDIQHRRGPLFHPMQVIDKRRIRKLARPEVEYPEIARAA